MSLVRVSSSAIVRATARDVYRLIADYRDGHPRILPPRYFPRLEVERGGTGAGTIIRYQFRASRVTREIRAEISEPERGRILAETDLAGGARTTFTVTPEGGRSCTVAIETVWEAKGIRGWIEAIFAPRLLRRIYAEELGRLAVLAEKAASPAPAEQGAPPTRAEKAGPPTPAGKAAPPEPAFKVHRNDPCPCGTGLKYKQCCGAE